MAVQYDENLRYKGELDLSASEVDELFHAVMHHQERLAKRVQGLHPHAITTLADRDRKQLHDTEHVLITLRKVLKRYGG